jgi:hypothetical protein
VGTGAGPGVVLGPGAVCTPRRATLGRPPRGTGPQAGSRKSRKTAFRPLATDKNSDTGGKGKDTFGDELLDFMYAGKKLRKWYGETDMVLPRDGGPVDTEDDGQEPADERDIPRRSVIILYPEDDRFPMSEQTLLQLILRRAEVLVVTKDPVRAREGYGTYVEAIALDSSRSTRRALRGAKSVVICGPVTQQVREVLKMAGVPRVVLLVGGESGEGASGGMFAGMFESAERRELKNVARREAVMQGAASAWGDGRNGPCEVVCVALSHESTRGRENEGEGDQGRQAVANALAESALAES